MSIFLEYFHLQIILQSQYNFIHDALNELIVCGDSEITAPNLRIVISRLSKTKDGETGYSKQFSVSQSLCQTVAMDTRAQPGHMHSSSLNCFCTIAVGADVPSDFRIRLHTGQYGMQCQQKPLPEHLAL